MIILGISAHPCSPSNGVTISIDSNCYVIEVVYPEIYQNMLLTERTLSPGTILERSFNEINFEFLTNVTDPFKYSNPIGGPDLPYLSFNLQIPDFSSVNAFVEYIEYGDEIQLDYPYVPAQDMLETEISDSFSFCDELYNHEVSMYLNPAEVTPPYTFIETTGITVNLKPFIYSPLEQIIKPIHRIRYIVCVSGNETLLDMYNRIINSEELGNEINFYNTYCGDIIASTDIKGNYLIITTPEYADEAETYAQHKRNLGYNAWVNTFDTQYCEEIQQYLIDEYNGRRPRYVLIIGDEDDIPYSSMSPLHLNDPKTDIYYACTNPNYYTGQTILNPTMFVGRWPIHDHYTLRTLMDKSIRYDLIIPESRRIALFTGTGNSSTQDFAYTNLYVEDLITNYVNNNTCIHYDGHLGYNSSTMSSEFEEHDDLMMLYRGHGGEWGFGSPFSLVNMFNLPTNLPYFTFSFCCNTGVSSGLGGLWVTEGDRSLTFYGSPVVTYTNSNNNFSKTMFSGLKDYKNYTIGQFVYLGIARYQSSGGNISTIKSYVLYGDPSLYIYGMEFLGHPVEYMPSRDIETIEQFENSISEEEIFSCSINTILGVPVKIVKGTKVEIDETLDDLEKYYLYYG